MRLSALALGGASSILSGLLVLILSIWNAATGFGEMALKLFISLHPTVFDRTATVGFVLVNTVYALIDGFLLGMALAFIYNFLAGKKQTPPPPAV